MRLATVLIVGMLAGCATSHTVLLGDLKPHPALKTAALVPQDGNSKKMDQILEDELKANGLEVKPALPAVTRQAPDIDVIVAYVDHWWWDLAMYLRSIDLSMYDGKTGSLLALGHWQDSALHGFREPKVVVHEVVPEMLSRLGVAQTEGNAVAPK